MKAPGPGPTKTTGAGPGPNVQNILKTCVIVSGFVYWMYVHSAFLTRCVRIYAFRSAVLDLT